MAYQANFKRYELKYLLTRKQKKKIVKEMVPFMKMDHYGRTTIRNIYYDTDSYMLVRHSIEQPVYKEKLRVRSYECPGQEDPVFVELKKKYESVVYKRRISLPRQQAYNWLKSHDDTAITHSQIEHEINYFCKLYETLHPAVFLSYEREAYFALDGSDFRVTFDENILARDKALSLEQDIWGTLLLEDDQVLMEIKTSGGIPLWMVNILSKEKIYKTTFSKYGTAYKKMIFRR